VNIHDIYKLEDAAKRLSDTVSLHMMAAIDRLDPVNRWCAFKLEDGSSDGALYDSKDDAIRHQKGDTKQYCYLKITPDGITVKDAKRFLRINRLPMIDTTSPEHVINPHIYPRFSNLSAQAKYEINRRLKIQQEKDREND
jgi:hypothetical protein